jgi:hypothetical protein
MDSTLIVARGLRSLARRTRQIRHTFEAVQLQSGEVTCPSPPDALFDGARRGSPHKSHRKSEAWPRIQPPQSGAGQWHLQWRIRAIRCAGQEPHKLRSGCPCVVYDDYVDRGFRGDQLESELFLRFETRSLKRDSNAIPCGPSTAFSTPVTIKLPSMLFTDQNRTGAMIIGVVAHRRT